MYNVEGAWYDAFSVGIPDEVDNGNFYMEGDASYWDLSNNLNIGFDPHIANTSGAGWGGGLDDARVDHHNGDSKLYHDAEPHIQTHLDIQR